MYIAILGRQPAIGVAELERLYGQSAVAWFGEASATIESVAFDFHHLGGSLKAGRTVLKLPGGNWRHVSAAIIEHYLKAWRSTEHKITLGISVYGWDVVARDVQGTGIILKKKLRAEGVSLRLVPNQDSSLSTATSHHNRLGTTPHRVELLVVRGASGRIIVAESVGAQNISAFAARDQARPKTDAFVGMLPPKLARIMINLTGIHSSTPSRHSPGADSDGSAFPAELGQENSATSDRASLRSLHQENGGGRPTVLDPFCGTGVVLQEALLLGHEAYGTDLSEKMVDYSQQNLAWLTAKSQLSPTAFRITQGDAMTHTWPTPIDAVATEAYLGQPFSAPPSAAKLTEVRGNCDHIISTFLKNIHPQLAPGTPLCLAIPAWNDGTGHFTHLPLVGKLERLGYQQITLTHVRPEQLLYYREGQVVARELLILARN